LRYFEINYHFGVHAIKIFTCHKNIYTHYSGIKINSVILSLCSMSVYILPYTVYTVQCIHCIRTVYTLYTSVDTFCVYISVYTYVNDICTFCHYAVCICSVSVYILSHTVYTVQCIHCKRTVYTSVYTFCVYTFT
jgi:hypothetical protein